jgi:diketogulonate reductase-like aldo/keto reductase
MFTQTSYQRIASVQYGLAKSSKSKEGAVAVDFSITVQDTRIPKLGFGTWELRGEVCARMVAEALKVGYRHIDTAQGYANENEVGDGIAASGIPRNEIFVTTKLQPQRLSDGVLQRSVEDSLKKLRTEIDLLLVHWPNPEIPLAETMRAISDAKRQGLTRNIGVSNFTIAHLGEAMATTSEPIVAGQIEYHPYLDQSRVLAAMRRYGLAVIAYCPIALGKVVNDERLVDIGRKYGKSAVQVTLRWLVQQDGVAAIPRTARVERLKENLAVFDFALTDEEMLEIGDMAVPNSRLINEPQWVPKWD